MGKDLHKNSIESFDEQKDTGRTEHFRRAIFKLLQDRVLTDRQVMTALGEGDVNNIRPEITRLKQDGLIREVDKVTCPETGKKVRRTSAVTSVYTERDKSKQDRVRPSIPTATALQVFSRETLELAARVVRKKALEHEDGLMALEPGDYVNNSVRFMLVMMQWELDMEDEQEDRDKAYDAAIDKVYRFREIFHKWGFDYGAKQAN